MIDETRDAVASVSLADRQAFPLNKGAFYIASKKIVNIRNKSAHFIDLAFPL